MGWNANPPACAPALAGATDAAPIAMVVTIAPSRDLLFLITRYSNSGALEIR